MIDLNTFEKPLQTRTRRDSDLTPEKKPFCLAFQAVVSLNQNPDTSKIRCFFIDLCRHSISYFSATTGLMSSNNVSTTNVTPLECDSIEKSLILILASKY